MKKTLLNSMLFGTAGAMTAVNATDFVSVVKVDEDYVYVAQWTDWGSHGEKFNCTDWTPSPDDIPFGFEYEQSMDCEQNQSRFKGGLTEDRVIIVTEKRNEIGTNNFKTGEVVEGAWSSWKDSSLDYDCSEWSPSPSEIPYGDSFTQSRDCSLNQISTRVIDEVWADGSTTYKESEDKFRTISVTRTQLEIGTQNFKTGTENIEDWSSWSNFNGLYSCSSWTPLTSDFDLGTNFVQTSDCKQDQKRTRDVYDVWADGSETFSRTETDNQTIDSSKTQDAVGTRNFKTGVENIKDWSEWSDKNGHYDCDTWTPNVNTIPYGDSFVQTRNCKQDQDRDREIYDVWADGSETLNRIEPDSQTIIEEETQNAIGTQNFKTGVERVDSWSEWSNSGNLFNCSSWMPLTSTVNLGESFIQTSDCKQNQTRTRDVYDIWAEGSETFNRTETDNQTIDSSKTQSATGIKNFIASERSDSWGSWIDENDHYDCDIWTPNVNTVDYGDSFNQTRNCSQDQKRTKNVYDVWADGSETLNRVETDEQTITEQENRSSIGTKNFKDSIENGSWSNWTNSGALHTCGSWSPAPSTVNLGESFTQTSDCKQTQTRSRTIYDVWADGSKTVKTTESESKLIDGSKTRSSTGTKNYKTTTENGSWSSWSNDGGLFNCSSWSPLPKTISLGESFTQTSNCKQSQKRTRVVYDVWADGSRTENRTETGTQTINASKTQSATGTKNFIQTTRTGDWSAWVDSGSHYSCNSWSPSPSTVNLGSSFTQTRDCLQDQTRDRNIYNVWKDGSETLKSTENGIQVITEEESRASTGTKNYKTTTENGSWSAWVNSGGLHTCGSWSPLPNTVNLGESFTQTSNCKQNQTRTRTIYDVWADGSKTAKTTENGNQTIDSSKTQSATGTKNFIQTTRTANWGSWEDEGSHYDCDSWSPNPNTVNLGSSFTQTRDCSQAQTRDRNIYNVWKDGSETLKNTETGNQIITEEESRSLTGTKNFKTTTENGAWSSWSNSGNLHSCGAWYPLANTINYGSSFTQTSDCKQNQTRSRTIYDVWADGSKTAKTTENGTQTVDSSKTQSAIGTKNYKTGATTTGSWSAWSNIGGKYNCGTWSPSVDTVNQGQSFTQTSNCKQNQTRERDINYLWADGSQTFKNKETETKVSDATKTQSATGTMRYVVSIDDTPWTYRMAVGTIYDCSPWTGPDPSTAKISIERVIHKADCYRDYREGRSTVERWSDGQAVTIYQNRTIVEYSEYTKGIPGTKPHCTHHPIVDFFNSELIAIVRSGTFYKYSVWVQGRKITSEGLWGQDFVAHGIRYSVGSYVETFSGANYYKVCFNFE